MRTCVLRPTQLCALLISASLGNACYGSRDSRAADTSAEADASLPAPTSGPVLPRDRPGDGGAARIDAAKDTDDGGMPLVCPQGGKAGAVLVEFECRSVTVYTCKDLSNIVLEFEDGSRERFEGQNGHSNAFSGTGANAGKQVVRVWVKAGANHSGDGPGYGERVEAPDQSCDPPAAGSGGAGGAGGSGDDCVVTPDHNCVPIGGIGGRSGPDGPAPE